MLARGLGQHFGNPGHSIQLYYMASSVNGQDEPIRRCDWVPERARWRCHRGHCLYSTRTFRRTSLKRPKELLRFSGCRAL